METEKRLVSTARLVVDRLDIEGPGPRLYVAIGQLAEALAAHTATPPAAPAAPIAAQHEAREGESLKDRYRVIATNHATAVAARLGSVADADVRNKVATGIMAAMNEAVPAAVRAAEECVRAECDVAFRKSVAASEAMLANAVAVHREQEGYLRAEVARLTASLARERRGGAGEAIPKGDSRGQEMLARKLLDELRDNGTLAQLDYLGFTLSITTEKRP